MGMAKPTGEYAEQMLGTGGWPEVDEDIYHDRAGQYYGVLRQLTEVLEACRHQQSEIFDGGIWSGSAASAANDALGSGIDELTTLQHGLAAVITWHRFVAVSIVQAKSDIGDNVEAAQRQVNSLENDPSLDDTERITAINTVVIAAHGANVSVVAGTAEHILASKVWRPPDNALEDLLDQKAPPPSTLPETPSPAPPVEEERPRPRPPQPAPVPPTPVLPGSPPLPGGGSQLTPGMPPLPGGPAVPPVPAPGGGSGPTVSGAPGGAPAAPLSPAAAATPLSAGGLGKGLAPASLASRAPAPGLREDPAPPAAPAGAAGMPATQAGSAASRGAGAGSGAPAGQKPATKPPTTRPAAAARTAKRSESAAPPESTDDARSADAAVIAPIPVSAARAERDFIVEASTADAARRSGADPLLLGRRVAAALNAPGTGGEQDFGFFWVTGVTTDGVIVVANSYGLAYLPGGVQLPEPVHMASADHEISASERARWATYPVLAVQAWAAHRNTELRAVIGTEEQLANSDAGAARVVLTPEDIPDSGGMVGRTRLEVVDPEAADRLAAISDPRLVELLPPAPADAGPPADRRHMLWFGVMKPMTSQASGREVAHLRAFHTYAAHAQEIVLNEAHTAADPVAQRSAVADWLYWKHLTGLLDAALATAP